MQLHDTIKAYGLISRLNHWLGALLVIVLLGLGLYFHEMPKGEELTYWRGIHIGLGTLGLLFLLFRIVWRGLNRHTQPALQVPSLQKASHITHLVLSLSLLLMLITGPLIIWSVGRPINVFDWFQIASPLAKNVEFHHLLEDIHKIASRVLLVVLIVHVVATLKHAILTPEVIRGRMFGAMKK